MLRGINRQTIFEDEEDMQKLLETIKKYKTIRNMSVVVIYFKNDLRVKP